jgi:hypothetical protein
MKVELSELRRAANRLFDHLEQQGVQRVEFTHDHYWSVPREARHNLYEEPRQLEVGQLSEDLANLRSLSSASESVISYGLVWLAEVLREIGEQQVA